MTRFSLYLPLWVFWILVLTAENGPLAGMGW